MAELALAFAVEYVKPGGAFLVKMFQGESYELFVAQVRRNFQRVAVRKPDASRDRSNEVYILGTGKKA